MEEKDVEAEEEESEAAEMRWPEKPQTQQHPK